MNDDDQFAAARGILIGVAISAGIWMLMLGMYFLWEAV